MSIIFNGLENKCNMEIMVMDIFVRQYYYEEEISGQRIYCKRLQKVRKDKSIYMNCKNKM
jgi:hypothetical protein